MSTPDSATAGQVRELARRALEAFKADGPMYVSPAEYRIIRNVPSETWDEAVVAECAELGMTPHMLEAVAVIVRRAEGTTNR